MTPTINDIPLIRGDTKTIMVKLFRCREAAHEKLSDASVTTLVSLDAQTARSGIRLLATPMIDPTCSDITKCIANFDKATGNRMQADLYKEDLNKLIAELKNVKETQTALRETYQTLLKTQEKTFKDIIQKLNSSVEKTEDPDAIKKTLETAVNSPDIQDKLRQQQSTLKEFRLRVESIDNDITRLRTRQVNLHSQIYDSIPRPKRDADLTAPVIDTPERHGFSGG